MLNDVVIPNEILVPNDVVMPSILCVKSTGSAKDSGDARFVRKNSGTVWPVLERSADRSFLVRFHSRL